MPPRPPGPVHAPPPECPRCGYDLSGAIAAWPHDRCPCEGRCSECGLAILWRDVLNPAYAVSELFFETAKRSIGRAFLRTWWQSLRPWKLWRGAQLQFAVHAVRLTIFVILAVAQAWLLCAVIMALTAWLARAFMWGRGWWVTWWTAPGIDRWPALLQEAFWPIDMSWRWGPTFPLPPWLALGWLWMLLTLFMLRLVPQTLRRAKVRPSHVARIWAYSLVGAPLLLYVPTISEWVLRSWPWLQTAIGPALLDHRGLVAVGLLVLWGAWLLVCWGSAAKYYLRLDRPWIVASTLILLSGLFVVTFAVVGALASTDVLKWMMNELG